MLCGCPQLQRDDFRVSTSALGGETHQDDAGATNSPSGGAGGAPTVTSTTATGGLDASAATTPLAAGGTTSEVTTCDWSNIVPLTGLNVSGEQWGANFSADGSTLFFSAVNGNSYGIYTATRPDRGTAFTATTLVTLGTYTSGSTTTPPVQPQTPFLSSDGLSLYFVANSTSGDGDTDIWVTTRATASGAFSSPRPFPSLNSAKDDARPWFSADDLTIYFASNRTGTQGDFDIWMATRTGRYATFSSPVVVTAVNSAYRDDSPFMTADGLTLYFSSDRLGSRDIWRATRVDTSSDFGAPAQVSQLNSPAVETDVAVSSDNTELFFSSGNSGTPLIWRASMVCAGKTQ